MTMFYDFIFDVTKLPFFHFIILWLSSLEAEDTLLFFVLRAIVGVVDYVIEVYTCLGGSCGISICITEL